MAEPLTVAHLRAALAGLPGDAPVVITGNPMWEDCAVRSATRGVVQIWDHDCTDWDDNHVSPRDCPTTEGLRIVAERIEDLTEEEVTRDA